MAQFSFLLETTPKGYLTINDEISKLVKRVTFIDDVEMFFPQINMIVDDSSGYISDKLQFIEGLEFDAYLGIQGDLQANYDMHHSFYFGTNDIIQPHFSSVVNGTMIWRGMSLIRKKDSITSKAYGATSSTYSGTALSSIVSTIATSMILDPTKNMVNVGADLASIIDIFYQANERNETFLKKLAKRAYGGSPATPILTFFNLDGDFYFDSISNFFNKPVDIDCDLFMDPEQLQLVSKNINAYNFKQGGFPVNESNYFKEIYTLDGSGITLPSIDTLSNYKVVPIIGTELSSTSNVGLNIQMTDLTTPKTFQFLGLQSNPQQKDKLKAKQILAYSKSLQQYVFDVTIPFNKACKAGKIAELQWKSSTSSIDYSKVFGGKWMITRSEHVFETDKFTAWSHLTLRRPFIGIDKDNMLGKTLTTSGG